MYKTIDKIKTEKIDKIVSNSWIELINPTAEEIKDVVSATNVDGYLINKVLDEEELPRIEIGKTSTLIVIDTPYLVDTAYKNKYYTYPLGLIIGKEHIISISLKELMIFDDFKHNKIKEFYTEKKTRFILQILLKIASTYQKDLKVIDDDISNKEKYLHKSTKNKELLDLLNIEKTLVYFITSLKANDIVLEKLAKGSILPLYDNDSYLLEDALIENKQAIEMANIYREILTSMTDTYATIISNNLNGVMKFLAGITIVFSIPTMISSFLGMNVSFGFLGTYKYSFWIIILLSLIVSFIVSYILKKKDML
ncbi:MAG: magnesium transporter CorA family protein [Bacilli bacterium]